MPDDFLVPGSRPLIERLTADGLLLVIASGTELADVRREAVILQNRQILSAREFSARSTTIHEFSERARPPPTHGGT